MRYEVYNIYNKYSFGESFFTNYELKLAECSIFKKSNEGRCKTVD